MAGGLVQCPRCRRLVDVPTIGEMTRIDADGGYKFEDEPAGTTAQPVVRLDTTSRAFGAARVDDFGEDIDMRATFEDIQRAGVENAPGTLGNGRPVSPKYDPISGELIRPLTVKGEEPKRVLALQPAGTQGEEVLDAIPVPLVKLHYSTVPQANISLGAVFMTLLRPTNVIVMSFVLIGHMMAQVTGLIVIMGFIFVFIAPLLLIFAIFGHYGNTIEEIGPGGRDELPTPMRDASFYADIWQPFTQVLTALFVAYLPLIIAGKLPLTPDLRQILQLAMCVAGTVLAPGIGAYPGNQRHISESSSGSSNWGHQYLRREILLCLPHIRGGRGRVSHRCGNGDAWRSVAIWPALVCSGFHEPGRRLRCARRRHIPDARCLLAAGTALSNASRAISLDFSAPHPAPNAGTHPPARRPSHSAKRTPGNSGQASVATSAIARTIDFRLRFELADADVIKIHSPVRDSK